MKHIQLPEKQQVKNKFWEDENGIAIPVNRITPLERRRENYAHQLAKEAHQLHKKLAEFKQKAFDLSNKIYDEYMRQKQVDTQRKGNFVWYDFDRKIRIEVDNKTNIKFDDLAIEAAKKKLFEFLNKEINIDKSYIKDLIMSAFETRRGKLDVKKILQLMRYRDRIKDPLFGEALDILEEGIVRDESRKYMRFSVRHNDEWVPIDLNFSSIKP